MSPNLKPHTNCIHKTAISKANKIRKLKGIVDNLYENRNLASTLKRKTKEAKEGGGDGHCVHTHKTVYHGRAGAKGSSPSLPRATGVGHLRARQRRGFSPELPHATGSRPNSGRHKFSIFFRLAAAASRPKPPLATVSSVASRVFGRLAAAANREKKFKKLDRLAAAASQQKSGKGKEKTTCGSRKSEKNGKCLGVLGPI